MDSFDNDTPGGQECNWVQKLCYGMGHVYNDLCAAMWFSYTLFYFQIVLQIESKTAGLLIMTGTLAVFVGFSLIFCLRPAPLNIWTIIYYGLVISLFQIGWAIAQISHLSIIPEIAVTPAHTSDLTAIRYTASVCCNILVYLITLVILKNDQDPTKIGPNDFYKFKKWIDVNSASSRYMASRLFTTLTLIYIPLYLDEREIDPKIDGDGIRQTIASIPLTCFIASFLTSIFLKYRCKCFTDKVVYFIGITLALVSSSWIGLRNSSSSNVQLYVIATLIGISGSTTMVASLCLTAEFVKTNGYGGASVYSTVTFTDKLISGVVVLIVQNLRCSSKDLCPDFYKNVLFYVCGSVSIIGLVSLIALKFSRL